MHAMTPSSSFEKHSSPGEISREEDIFAFYVFLSLGCCGLLAWNAFLNVLPSILTVIYPSVSSFSDTITATYFTVVCTFSLSLSLCPIRKVSLLICSLSGILLHLIAVPILCLLVPPHYASLALHMYCGTLGFFVGTTVNGSIAIASTLPKMYVAPVGGGMGFAGVFTFVIWVVTSFCENHYNNTKVTTGQILISMYILYGACAAYVILTIIMFLSLIQRPWIIALFEKHEKKQIKVDTCSTTLSKFNKDFGVFSNTTDDIEEDGDTIITTKEHKIKNWDKHQLFSILRLIRGNITLRFFIFFFTLLVFPTIGPLSWNDQLIMTDIITGCFQLCDFLGRIAPPFFPILIIKEKTLAFLLISRLTIVILFILSMIFSQQQHHSSFWSNSIFHCIEMIALSFTNGWFSTVATIHLPQHVSGTESKSIASSIGMAIGFFGIVSGQWASHGLKAVLLKVL